MQEIRFRISFSFCIVPELRAILNHWIVERNGSFWIALQM